MNNKQKSQNLSSRKIINAAIVLFANKGYESTTTREICKYAEVNLSLISYYFKNKEGLYLSIIESIVNYGLTFLKDDIEKANDILSMSYQEKTKLLLSLLEKYTTFLYSESVPNNFVILMLKEQTLSKSQFGDLYSKKIQLFYQALRKILASILGRKEDDKAVIFEVSSMVGEILSFKLMDKATLLPLKQSEYTKEDTAQIKKIILSHIKNNLEALGVKLNLAAVRWRIWFESCNTH